MRRADMPAPKDRIVGVVLDSRGRLPVEGVSAVPAHRPGVRAHGVSSRIGPYDQTLSQRRKGLGRRAALISSTDTELIDAILESREQESLRLTDDLLAAGVSPRRIEDLCSEAMQAIGRGFRPDPGAIEEIVTADRIFSEILGIVHRNRSTGSPERHRYHGSGSALQRPGCSEGAVRLLIADSGTLIKGTGDRRRLG